MHRLPLLRLPSAASAAALLAIVACALPASAVAGQRSFVASTGNDANPCTLQLPCRGFNAAITATNPGGEVVILDTAGYGPMTINKSIKIIGPSGVYGGISVIGGIGPPPPPTTGILINAGDTDVITLRGLDVSGVPGAAPLPQYGIDIQNAGAVHIEKSSIGNFTQDTSSCIHLDTARAVQVFVVDSFLRECRTGVSINGSGPTNAERPSVEIDNTRIENALNTVAAGTSGLVLTGNFAVTFRDGIISGAGDGIFASNSIATATARAYLIRSHITRAGNAAIEMTGGNSANLVVNISNSVLNLNGSALLHGHGGVRLTSNVITNNTNSLVTCGGNPLNVESYGYGGALGSNLITDFTNAVLPGSCTAFIAAPVIVNGL